MTMGTLLIGSLLFAAGSPLPDHGRAKAVGKPTPAGNLLLPGDLLLPAPPFRADPLLGKFPPSRRLVEKPSPLGFYPVHKSLLEKAPAKQKAPKPPKNRCGQGALKKPTS
jgi:hypothetical protein